MKPVPDRLWWALYPRLLSRAWRLRHGAEHGWILGRHACLGNTIAQRLGISRRIYNIQKGRVDLLMDVIEGCEPTPRTQRVAPHMARRDIIPLIAQQQDTGWRRWPPPTLIFMDSYAELVDQRFTHHTGRWSFCACYSDIRHDDAFERRFRADGLLPADQLQDAYARFFTFLRARYGAVPIVFLHFPVALDNRARFTSRYTAIHTAIDAVSGQFQPFHPVEVDSGRVGWPEDAGADRDRFPYHFNTQTYDGFCEQLAALDVFGTAAGLP